MIIFINIDKIIFINTTVIDRSICYIFYKMEPPGPEMDAKWKFKTHLEISFSFFEPFRLNFIQS
jgi:hypothetical protein